MLLTTLLQHIRRLFRRLSRPFKRSNRRDSEEGSLDSTNENNLNDFGKYHILNVIGSGGFGIVYKVRCNENGKLFALKKLDDEYSHPRRITEYRILSKVKHSNIVCMCEILKDSESPKYGIVFELMDYSLYYIRHHARARIPENHIRYITRKILSGVAYLHRKGIMHRDIKLGNILLNSMGKVKISDFGLACEFDVKHPYVQYNSSYGTNVYMAPEILLGAVSYTPAIDIWAVGCVFGHLLTGNYLFTGNSTNAIIGSIFQILGLPSESTWPGVSELPLMENWIPVMRLEECTEEKRYSKRLPSTKDYKFLEKLLCMNPHKRISAAKAIRHRYLRRNSRSLKSSLFSEWLKRNVS